MKPLGFGPLSHMPGTSHSSVVPNPEPYDPACRRAADGRRRMYLLGAATTGVSTTAKPDDQPEGERQRRSDGLDLTPRELSVIDLLREGSPIS